LDFGFLAPGRGKIYSVFLDAAKLHLSDDSYASNEANALSQTQIAEA
jgi:hypothetical protein